MKRLEIQDDIVLAKFINYMNKSLYCKRLKYYVNLNKINEHETTLDEIKEFSKELVTNENQKLDILNEKEIYLLNLHYKHGLSYDEISKITNEKIGTLKQRRNRAINKLNKKMEEYK